MTNQSGINLNTARQSSTGSSHIFWLLYLSGQCTIKREYKETIYFIYMPYISWVRIESNTK